jgi:DNA-binding NarL/FixJ family response regulator
MTAPAISVVPADDQAMVRKGFRVLLEAEAGIEVVTEAADGHEAVAKVARHHPAVALMDIQMPGMDGLEATGAYWRPPATSRACSS